MPIVSNTIRLSTDGRPAHDMVQAHRAQELYASNGVDWTVSGDATLAGYGTIGTRRASQRVNIWALVRQ